MIFRSHKLLFWQYIEWTKVVQYIDSLKSRKYQKFIEKNYKEKSQDKNFFVTLSIEILFALRHALREDELKLNEFELGYLLYCCSHVLILDVSFFFIIEIIKYWV